uniref:Uncharacterized protein n=1 Tax=Anguilla anguilla TaxID=7936 RepID=A0A0E9U397_ANGAN
MAGYNHCLCALIPSFNMSRYLLDHVGPTTPNQARCWWAY